MPRLPSDPASSRADLLALSAAMAREGRTLIERVLPAPPEVFTQWQHYPPGDATDPDSQACWYYHAHPPEQRGEREHGHFHLFLPLAAFAGEEVLASPAGQGAAQTVHVAALCFDVEGLPTGWIATSRWVTEDWFFAAPAMIARLDRLDLSRAGEAQGLAEVSRWLTLAAIACHQDLAAMLHRRDALLAQVDPDDRSTEVLASAPFAV
ncbi:MAG: hypothetical protein KDE15_02620 [Erythrobacter sp.]|nr:hypothetical protein [Erythrobacter sp.]